MRPMAPLQASMASLNMVFPHEAWPTMAKLRKSFAESVCMGGSLGQGAEGEKANSQLLSGKRDAGGRAACSAPRGKDGYLMTENRCLPVAKPRRVAQNTVRNSRGL